MNSIYFITIAGCYVIAFIIGRISTEPLNELRPDRMRGRYGKLAEKSLLRIPCIVSLILFFCIKKSVTFYSVFYQIIWYILLARGINLYVHSKLPIEVFTKQLIDPLFILMAVNIMIGYIILKVDDKNC